MTLLNLCKLWRGMSCCSTACLLHGKIQSKICVPTWQLLFCSLLRFQSETLSIALWHQEHIIWFFTFFIICWCGHTIMNDFTVWFWCTGFIVYLRCFYWQVQSNLAMNNLLGLVSHWKQTCMNNHSCQKQHSLVMNNTKGLMSSGIWMPKKIDYFCHQNLN